MVLTVTPRPLAARRPSRCSPALMALLVITLMASVCVASGRQLLKGTPKSSRRLQASVCEDTMYDDENVHICTLNRIMDWDSMNWGVQSLTVGTTVTYDKYAPLAHTSWRFIHDTADGAGTGPDNAILLSRTVMHIVSRDLKLVWYADPSGYVTLADYATALQGDLDRIRVRFMDKHGQARLVGTPLQLGFHWSKMRFDAPRGTDVTPTDSGLAWQPKSDASYLSNRKQWFYGFEVQDVDWTNPDIL